MKTLLFVLLIFLPRLDIYSTCSFCGTYSNVDAYRGAIISLNNNGTYTYGVDYDIFGSLKISGKYLIKGNKIHLIIKKPITKAKSFINYRKRQDSLSYLELTDNDHIPYIGAVVSYDKFKLSTDINGRLSINENWKNKRIKVEYPGIKDSLFYITKSSGFDVVINIALKDSYPVTYNLLFPDWIISKKRLYPIYRSVHHSSYYLKKEH